VAYPTLCPKCLSRYPDIRGMIFPVGSCDGTQCEDGWHKGPDYDPNVLVLTEKDRVLLSKALVKF
jgi:hypothetical protein